MKQIKYLIVGILVFVTGITLVSAADKTYYLDYTTAGDHDVTIEQQVLEYLWEYFTNEDITDTYTITEYYETGSGEQHFGYKNNDKLLFTWHCDENYVTVESNLTESDNFTIDVLSNVIDEEDSPIFTMFNYTKINVVFKSSTSVPKNNNDLTIDLTVPLAYSLEAPNVNAIAMMILAGLNNNEFTSQEPNIKRNGVN